jgi:hypothetical protein
VRDADHGHQPSPVHGRFDRHVGLGIRRSEVSLGRHEVKAGMGDETGRCGLRVARWRQTRLSMVGRGRRCRRRRRQCSGVCRPWRREERFASVGVGAPVTGFLPEVLFEVEAHVAGDALLYGWKGEVIALWWNS